ncbi:hypothetical protein PS870_01315 [Pseudomonas fluorescens]|uniref:Type I restriction modification DNA specificity domain-containing protein n=1 Tax=Pseudomonas fluorescens TaxID=294 RepID=A0A5E7I566_PSEFL|nr:restriction endonuclease subunit S [Pseudomonas fluorescens]VVO71390.1 hypothetical protein PS870_01315 [Pseudomonas fluorescens]
MSDMNFIEKLLDGVGVEWSALGKLLVRTKGTKITAGQMKELHKNGAPLKVFAGGKTIAFVDFEDIPAADVNREPSIIVKSRGVIEFEYYEKPFTHKNEMWSYHSSNDKINIKYVYYFLKLNEPHFQNVGSKMQMPQIATPDTDKFQIPIPCPGNPEKSFEIQSEIVRILDAFTTLTAELTAQLTVELSARRKQYNYYRDQLLSFEEDEVKWESLEDACENISSGKNKDKSDVGLYPVYGSTGIIGRTNSKVYERDQILVARVGANAGRVNIAQGEYDVSDNTLIIQKKESIILKYLYYYLVNLNLNQFAKGAGQPLITAGQLKTIQIPVPEPKEQVRIVAILDKFDALTKSLSEGLSREIELRQKQYEHYRDLLLSFPKSEEVGA